jgi:hypothetical protein
MQADYDLFSTLDDSSTFLLMKNVPEIRYKLHFYVSALELEGTLQCLPIIKPARDKKNKTVKPILRRWLQKNVEGKLVACAHYHDYYKWLRREFDVEFVTRATLHQYPERVVKRFMLADEDARTRAKLARAMFSSENKNYEDNRKHLLRAIKKKEKMLDLGIIFYLTGFE